jgi:hypothetical protein
MSGRELSLVRADLVELTRTVARLAARVEALELREATGEGREVTESEFELVGAPSVSAQSAYSPASRVHASGLSPHRVAVAEEVGRFLGRASRGEFRGSSGRSKVNLSSRIYVVLAPFDGRLFPEPRLFTVFAKVRELCLRGPDSGDSIYVGLPSQAEAAIALRSAGLSWPAAGIDGRDGSSGASGGGGR